MCAASQEDERLVRLTKICLALPQAERGSRLACEFQGEEEGLCLFPE
jgi:hypothetical protein